MLSDGFFRGVEMRNLKSWGVGVIGAVLGGGAALVIDVLLIYSLGNELARRSGWTCLELLSAQLGPWNIEFPDPQLSVCEAHTEFVLRILLVVVLVSAVLSGVGGAIFLRRRYR